MWPVGERGALSGGGNWFGLFLSLFIQDGPFRAKFPNLAGILAVLLPDIGTWRRSMSKSLLIVL